MVFHSIRNDSLEPNTEAWTEGKRILTSITVSGDTSSMTITITITVKGQITIPLALRERFGLLPGTEVEFVTEADGLRLCPRKEGVREPSAFQSWLAVAADSARSGLTTDEAMALTRGED